MLVAVSGFGLDHGLGRREARARAGGGAVSGALFCPHGGSRGGAGWVVVANPGQRTVNVRVTSFSETGVGGVQSFPLAPSHEVFRTVPATGPSAATEVEFFGGWVGAAAVIAAGGPRPAFAAMSCVPGPRRTWFLPEVPTESGHTSFAVVMNPFAEPAQFDVVLQSEKRKVTPGELGPYVLPGRSSVALPVNRFLLAGPSEHAVTSSIVTRSGRVIAGALVSSAESLSTEAGVPAARLRWVIPAAAYTGPARIAIMNAGTSRADLSLIAVSASAETVVSGPSGVSINAGSVARISFPSSSAPVGNFGATNSQPSSSAPAGILEATNGQPLAVAMAVAGQKGDEDTILGSPSGFPGWLVLPSGPPKGGRSVLVLVNPGQIAAQITLSLFGPGGPLPSPAPISVGPGRLIIVTLPSPGGMAVSVMARAQSGTIVAGTASYSAGGGYAATLGLPISGQG
jgi:hypothetical protein